MFRESLLNVIFFSRIVTNHSLRKRFFDDDRPNESKNQTNRRNPQAQ